MSEELLPIAPIANGDKYPEIYNDYIRKQMQHLLLDGTYLNPLDSKLVNGLMTVIVMITAAVCITKLCKLHLSRHPTIHQYVIFYGATIQCLLCAVHWILGQYVQLDFIVQYLKLLQFLVVSHLYWTLATRPLQNEKLTSRLFIPVYMVALLYFTIVVIFGCINVQASWLECLKPYWLLLSCAEFILVQLFMISGIYITRRLNEISTLECVRTSQKRHLWILMFAFEVSSLCGLAYDVTLLSLGDETIGCSAIFYHMQRIYAPVFCSFMVIKLLIPMWAMLFVFHPIESPDDPDELLPPVTNDGVSINNYTSMFCAPFDHHRYRPLQPGSDLNTTDSDLTATTDLATPVFGPLRLTTSNLTPVIEELHNPEYISTSDRVPILS